MGNTYDFAEVLLLLSCFFKNNIQPRFEAFLQQQEYTDRLISLCDLIQLTEEIGKLEDKVECANNALKADWERWRQNMQNDIKSAFIDMAEENICYYEQVSSDMCYCFLLQEFPSLLLSVFC